jgi:hypothetical protein
MFLHNIKNPADYTINATAHKIMLFNGRKVFEIFL